MGVCVCVCFDVFASLSFSFFFLGGCSFPVAREGSISIRKGEVTQKEKIPLDLVYSCRSKNIECAKEKTKRNGIERVK